MSTASQLRSNASTYSQRFIYTTFHQYQPLFHAHFVLTSRIRNSLTALSDTYSLLRASLLGRRVDTYWYRGKPNFGDLITRELLSNYGLRPVYAPPETAQLACTGSILQVYDSTFDGIIAGAGLINDAIRPFPRATILGVRGTLTAERIGAAEGVVLGDPGLLAADLLKSRQHKEFELGIVPHYIDARDPRIAQWRRRLGPAISIIDVGHSPLTVFAKIDRCSHILSSSLHGLITADSLGIPSAWMKLSTRVIGDGFKFRDYGSALGEVPVPQYLTGTETLAELQALTRPSPSIISERKAALKKMFSEVAKRFVG